METKICPNCKAKDTTDFSTCRHCNYRYDYVAPNRDEGFDVGKMLKHPAGFIIFLVLCAVVFKPLRDIAIGAAVNKQVDSISSDLETSTQKLKANPKDYDALIKRGDALMVVFHTDGAVADYTAAIAARPGSAEAYRKRAEAYKALNDSAAEQKDLQMAEKLELGH
jgi:hypothetical protein